MPTRSRKRARRAKQVEAVVLKFTKDDKSPDDVRVTLREPDDRVLEPGRKTGKSKPRMPGKVKAFVEVKVSSPAGKGRTATISVTNTTQPTITVDVPVGKTGTDVTKTLTVVGKE